ncbi:MAG TPA: phosphate ABC transporter permease PstA [Anaerolineaceae bacterium]|jgi:phosphate transport system permease protein|nr:phosphate ABC transporter permease PstA [Anaerolineaceae bacterium]HOT26379.1 phosphate ABC transporter permease PstA [Anaerolineaceae bacterium]HQH58161.1 phosphate ABC transporter permease PstA [Anaerolineaceae bacterium]HQK03882.1 phosphate ABC transporter permease PstA [Anaerolineaceae bacterium]HQL27528.1 phosphate ABC transporter permease PstA [Anaerolineaceae bacterium]
MNVPDITSTNAMNLAEKRSAADLRRRQAAQKLSFGLFWLGALVVILIMLVVVGYVFITGFKSINLQFLTTPPKGGLSGEGGISTTVITTLYLVGLILAISAPLGIGAAVFLIEYQGQTQSGGKFIRSLLQVVNFGVETLAGIPSIIFGLFGYALFVSTLKFGFSLLSAALAGACLVLPTIIRTTQEALLTVPVSLREGSLALGATRWQTISKVVLPAAIPGIITGIMLSVGRIISETAVFYVTLGGSYRLPKNLFSGGRTLSLHLFYLAMDTNAFEKAMGTGAVLIVSIILINLIIDLISRKLSAGVRLHQ